MAYIVPVLLSGFMLVNTTMHKMIWDDVKETQEGSLIKGRHCSQAQNHPNRNHATLAVGIGNIWK
jgi:hypothetical protein